MALKIVTGLGFISLLILLCAFAAFAGEPHLAADPPADTSFTRYQVEIDDEVQPVVAAQVDGTMFFDVSFLPLGPTYTFRARGCTAWGQWSPWTDPLVESSAPPSGIENLRLVSD